MVPIELEWIELTFVRAVENDKRINSLSAGSGMSKRFQTKYKESVQNHTVTYIRLCTMLLARSTYPLDQEVEPFFAHKISMAYPTFYLTACNIGGGKQAQEVHSNHLDSLVKRVYHSSLFMARKFTTTAFFGR